jgi:hypothetical protein
MANAKKPAKSWDEMKEAAYDSGFDIQPESDDDESEAYADELEAALDAEMEKSG